MAFCHQVHGAGVFFRFSALSSAGSVRKKAVLVMVTAPAAFVV